MSTPKELIIYCDESINNGDHFTDFYGGVLVTSDHVDSITEQLNNKKIELNLFGEVKWTKVTSQYLDKYLALMDSFFALVHKRKLKVRIMFRQTAYEAVNLSAEQREQHYFLLYYQFIKHAFGLRYANKSEQEIYLRTYFDRLPHNEEKRELFKNHIFALQSFSYFEEAKIRIRRRDIAEVDSHQHTILQCLDIVLGAMAFRLNDLHKKKEPGQNKRGKRTIAKEKLYKHILAHIRVIHPNFNIGLSTGFQKETDLWHHPYKHWKFIPKEFKIDNERFKK